MKQSFPKARLHTIIAVQHGQHPAHAAVIIWKLVIQLSQHTAKRRCFLDEKDIVTQFGQGDCRLDAGEVKVSASVHRKRNGSDNIARSGRLLSLKSILLRFTEINLVSEPNDRP